MLAAPNSHDRAAIGGWRCRMGKCGVRAAPSPRAIYLALRAPAIAFRVNSGDRSLVRKVVRSLVREGGPRGQNTGARPSPGSGIGNSTTGTLNEPLVTSSMPSSSPNTSIAFPEKVPTILPSSTLLTEI